MREMGRERGRQVIVSSRYEKERRKGKKEKFDILSILLLSINGGAVSKSDLFGSEREICLA